MSELPDESLKLPKRDAPAADLEQFFTHLCQWCEDRRAYNEAIGRELDLFYAIDLRVREAKALNEQIEHKLSEIAALRACTANIGRLEPTNEANKDRLQTNTLYSSREVVVIQDDSDMDEIQISDSEEPLRPSADSQCVNGMRSGSGQKWRSTGYRVSKPALPKKAKNDEVIPYRPSDRPHDSCFCRPLLESNHTASIYTCFSEDDVEIILGQLRSWDGVRGREKEHQKYRAWSGRNGICLNRSVKSQGARRSKGGVACESCVDKRLFCWDRGEQDFKTIMLLPLPESRREGVKPSDLGYWKLP